MRVLTLTPFYPTASDDAAGCFAAEPLIALRNLGIDSAVIAIQPFYRAPSKPSPTNLPAAWLRYPCLPGNFGLPSSGALLYASLVSAIQRLHRSQRIDLIHAHAALPCGHAAKLLSSRLGIPWVLTVHGLDAGFTQQVSGMAGRWCKNVAQSVYRTAARVIGISGRVRDQILAIAGAPVNSAVVYNGVDCEKFRPPDHDGDHREANQPTILSVGNLIPIKGHDVLLRAVAVVTAQFPGLTCEIIGDGPERISLQHLTRQLGVAENVRFLGRQSRAQVADAMRRCSVFALPSRYEGLGCVYLEAMACAKPVIACRGQGIDEIVEHDRNGWLVPAGDVPELARGLTRILEDAPLRLRLGANARHMVLQKFTLDHQAGHLAAIYRECAA
ncbi:MAG TPA: glycosyltransferase [Terriglobales bacterium]